MMTAMTQRFLQRFVMSLGIAAALAPLSAAAASIDHYYYHLSVRKHIGTEVHHFSSARGSMNFTRLNHTQLQMSVLHRIRGGTGAVR